MYRNRLEKIPYLKFFFSQNKIILYFLGEDSIHESHTSHIGHPISNQGLVVKLRVLSYYNWKIVVPIKSASLLCTILTPKGPLSVWGTNGISGKYLQSEFISWFSETLFEDRKTE